MTDTTDAPWHDVRVHWPGGSSHIDGIRGWDRQHAIDNAQWNWGSANPYGTCERVEYLGIADERTDSDEAPRDWWASAPPADSDDAVDVVAGGDTDDDADVDVDVDSR